MRSNCILTGAVIGLSFLSGCRETALQDATLPLVPRAQQALAQQVQNAEPYKEGFFIETAYSPELAADAFKNWNPSVEIVRASKESIPISVKALELNPNTAVRDGVYLVVVSKL